MKSDKSKKKSIPYKVIGGAMEYLEVQPLPKILMDGLKGLDFLIYGGYVRDLIAKKHNPLFKEGFKDIDIILPPNSHTKLKRILESNGYRSYESESSIDYHHWGAVRSVYTLKKDGERNIQIAMTKGMEVLSPEDLKNSLLTTVMAVDLRCCSVAITSNRKLIEVLPGAFQDCKDMIYKESNLAAHKLNILERTLKLQSRGWRDSK